MDGVAPKQHGRITFAQQVAGVAGGMPCEIDGTHAGDHLVGMTKCYEAPVSR